MGRYLKITYTNNINYVLSRQFKGLSNLEIDSIKTNNYLIDPCIDAYNMNKIRIKFDGSILNRFSPLIIHDDVVNIYIVYEITDYYNDSNYPTLENCLFGSVKFTKNADIVKYGYFGYGIGFDRKGFFQLVMKLVKM